MVVTEFGKLFGEPIIFLSQLDLGNIKFDDSLYWFILFCVAFDDVFIAKMIPPFLLQRKLSNNLSYAVSLLMKTVALKKIRMLFELKAEGHLGEMENVDRFARL